MRESGGSVVATDYDQRVFTFACFVEFCQQNTDASVPSRNLAEVISEVFTHLGNVW